MDGPHAGETAQIEDTALPPEYRFQILSHLPTPFQELDGEELQMFPFAAQPSWRFLIYKPVVTEDWYPIVNDYDQFIYTCIPSMQVRK